MLDTSVPFLTGSQVDNSLMVVEEEEDEDNSEVENDVENDEDDVDDIDHTKLPKEHSCQGLTSVVR